MTLQLCCFQPGEPLLPAHNTALPVLTAAFTTCFTSSSVQPQCRLEEKDSELRVHRLIRQTPSISDPTLKAAVDF